MFYWEDLLQIWQLILAWALADIAGAYAPVIATSLYSKALGQRKQVSVIWMIVLLPFFKIIMYHWIFTKHCTGFMDGDTGECQLPCEGNRPCYNRSHLYQIRVLCNLRHLHSFIGRYVTTMTSKLFTEVLLMLLKNTWGFGLGLWSAG